MVLAAAGMGIRRFIHEQNAIPGMTNKCWRGSRRRSSSPWRSRGRSFPKEHTLLTGNPLRRQILGQVTGSATARHGEQDGFRLLVFGGSAGAHSDQHGHVRGAAPSRVGRRTAGDNPPDRGGGPGRCRRGLPDSRGSGRSGTVHRRYGGRLRQADLVICRAGATTIAEVTACGKACIFIPFPHAVDDHQRKNAEALLKKEAGFMLLEQELTGESLAQR